MVLLALVVLAALVARSNFLIDDAFISFRYAANWAEHGVPAYHVEGVHGALGGGAGEPVEGYSNFLWVTLLTLIARAGGSLEVGARVLGVAFGAATVLLTAHLARRRLGLDAARGLLVLLALVTAPSFAVWCTGGLETSSFGFLLLAAFAALSAPAEKRRCGMLAGICALLLALSRPEGFVWVLGIAAAATLAVGFDANGEGGRRGRLRAYFGIFLVGFAGYLAWRHALYGQWLPNTVQAKSGISTASVLRGLKTSAAYFLVSGLPAVALLGGFALVCKQRPQHVRGLALGSATVVLGGLLYNTAVGGDWMPFFRFLAPLAAFIALLCACLLAVLPRGLAAGCAIPLLVLQVLPLFNVQASPRSWREALDFRSFQRGYQTEWERWKAGNRNLAGFERIGRALGRVAEPDDSITFGAIGALGYYSNITIHDRNGLVDPEVAAQPAGIQSRSAGHDKRVPRAWFLQRKPRWFQAVWVDARLERQKGRAWDMAVKGLTWPVWVKDDGERELRKHCLPAVYVFDGDDELSAGSLLLLERTERAAEASVYWQR